MLITKQKDLDAFCESVKACAFITVDTEFLREKTYYPKLCLVQIGALDGKGEICAAAIDPLADGIDLAPVFDLLADGKILKIFHAARQDLEIFFNLTGKVVHPFFDTQIAAMVCGYGDSVGYESLVRNITGGELDKSSQFTNWANRPLSDKQITYALGDVTHLIKIYEHLAAELEKRGRTSWVFQEEAVLEDPATYDVDPDILWKKIKVRSPKAKTLVVLRGLAAWREQRARDKDIPKNWVMKDDTLADIAGQMPRDVTALKKIRNMSSDLAEGHVGKTLLGVIESALASDPSTWPAVQKRKPPSPNVTARAEILRLLLKLTAAEHGVAGKLIAGADDLEAIAQDGAQANVPALKGWRRELFGEDALKLIDGKLAVGLKDDKITIFPIEG